MAATCATIIWQASIPSIASFGPISCISASARFLALYDKAPEHGARMINNLLTTPEIKAPDFETRLGFIATQLQQA